tara:strand:+ start:3973 stop:5205 length:1233 start_codon:yes stop_codon:yes gene_type:complete
MQNIIINEGYNFKNNFFDGGSGSKIFLKGKKLLDLSFCAGSLLLGHNSKIFKKSLNEIIKKNISPLASPNFQAKNFANLLKKIVKHKDKFIFCNSGTEAVTKALRISHAISNKKMIIATTGSWHGSVDSLLFSPDKKLNPMAISEGILKTYKNNLKFIPYNNIQKSKKIILKNKSKISCVIVEPIQASLPIKKAENYLKFLRKITKKNKIILIFDEMITGLRTDGSTLQNYLKIKPDISTFGKCFGGGLPIGIIGVTKQTSGKLNKKKRKVFFGGTFSANSLSTYVGMQTTNFIIKNKIKIFSRLEKHSNFFEKKMNIFFEMNSIDAKVFRFKSLIRIVDMSQSFSEESPRDFFLSKKSNKIEKMRRFLQKKNINMPINGLIYFSDQTSLQDINYLIKNLKLAFKYNYKI